MSLLTCDMDQLNAAQRSNISQRFDGLQIILLSMGYPPTADRTKVPRSGFTDKDVTIACLCEGVDRLSLLLESGCHSSGDMLLVLSPTWLMKEPQQSGLKNDSVTGDTSTATLYVRQGISCDKGGNTFLDTFEPPRRVTYFLNSSFDVSLEKYYENVNCPTGSCPEITHCLMDTLFMRSLMAQSGIIVPATLAFPYKPTRNYDNPATGITICPIFSVEDTEDNVQTTIMAFLEYLKTTSFQRVVVKLCGSKRRQCATAQVYSVEATDAICTAVTDLFTQLTDGDIVLIEGLCDNVERAEPINPYHKILNGFLVTTRRDQGVRIEATVCRNPEDEASLTSVVCLTGEKVSYLKDNQMYTQSLDDTLCDWGISSEEKQQTLREELKSTSENIMKIIMSLEDSMSSKSDARTDFIGVDFVLTRRNGRLLPVPVDVACQNETSHRHIYDVVHPEQAGESVRPLLATMLARSMRYILKGKRILVLGAGYISKKFIWEAAREYGTKICLLDSDPNTYAAELVDEFIHFDFSDHTMDREHSKAIKRLVESNGSPVLDGCVTFWEDCVPLAAMVCEELSLVGSSVEAATTAKSKTKTQQFLLAKSELGLRTSRYASNSYRIASRDDIKEASGMIKFPAIMKPEFGTGSIGVKLMDSVQACYEYFDQIQTDYQTETDVPGVCHGEAMLLMDYIDGSDYVVDVVVFDKKLIAGFMHDKGPTRLPTFTKVSSCFPTRLPPSKANQIIFAAYQCCLGIGLDNGTFNVDMRMTTTGPKLIEINARMGGFDLRDCIKKCFKADIVLSAFSIACGIRPRLLKPKPSCCVMTLSLTASDHGHALTPDILNLLRKLDAEGVINFNQFEEIAQQKKFEEPFCSIGVVDKSFDLAKIKLTELGRFLGLDSETFTVSYCLSAFK